MYTGLWDSLVEALLTNSTRQSRGMSWAVAKARTPGIERELQMHVTWLLEMRAGSAEGELSMAPSSLFRMPPRRPQMSVKSASPQRKSFPRRKLQAQASELLPPKVREAVASSAGGFEARTLGRR